MMFPRRRLGQALGLLLFVLLPLPALAQTAAAAPSAPLKIESAWVRASVAGQSGTGGFMRLTASEPLTLVGVRSPAAGISEIHEMRMEGDIMRMRAIPELRLPAGQPVDLRPGGYHLMLMSLKAPLKAGTEVPVTLILRDAKGAERQVPVQLPVALRAPGSGGHGSGHGDGHRH